MNPQLALELFGTDQPVPEPRTLCAGALSCQFDDGALRALRWHGVEVVRAVSYLLRDRDWGTVPATLSELEVVEVPQAFGLRFVLTMATPQGSLRARASIRGSADGRVVFEVHATPDAALATNRCGFVVLHPAACAGRALEVEHTDGSLQATQFPLAISPGQPVFDIRALRHELDDGAGHRVQVQVRLEASLPGDPAGKFEMEDQRNWSDASFKTYVASLLDPWPYTLPACKGLHQRVTVSLQGGAPAEAPPLASAHRAPAPTALQAGTPGTIRMPAIGVGVPPGLHKARAVEHEALRRLGAQWWIVEAALDDEHLTRHLAAVAVHGRGCGCQVQLDVVADAVLAPEVAAERAALACRDAHLEVQAVRVLPEPYLKSHQPGGRWPDLPPLEAYAQAARRHFPGAKVGGGMFTGFTELNRKRPDAQGLDFIGHLTWPIVHDAGDAAVMQTLEALPHIVGSVHTLWPGLPYRLGPSTIAMRRNPYGDQPAANTEGRRLALARSDPRHRARFGAAWTLGYAAAVAPLGLEVLALHESHGPSGPVRGQARSLVPAWGVLERLARAVGAHWVAVDGVPEGTAVLAWQHPGHPVEGLLANLTAVPLPVRLLGGREAPLGPYEVIAVS